ncbi:hypothetical protein PoB_003067300 [Plakobranchus ocellatus]|uniref:Uncharacterized protein n=1 Tax=Plakobranchus ocellatus TaxID=259542 RepID=A0AAV4ACA0_9GAST|nr:hypothetical protein PoB_003067300 [Plakobranchus ocellatus]
MRTQTGAPTVESVDLKVRGTKKEDRLIKMVVAIAIVFIICTTPGVSDTVASKSALRSAGGPSVAGSGPVTGALA